jgi:SAM-dependent methyltransferase
MSEYYWDSKIEYLRKTRDLYYNDDYLAFLVKSVWKMNKPVRMIDFGCGFGYVGLKLLPLLPKGSTYTGIDISEQLINEAKEIFQQLPYPTEFFLEDIHEVKLERKYDLAICHAFLLHVPEPKKTLQNMADCVTDEGRVICFEPHWIANMSNYQLDEMKQTNLIPLGNLQKLYEKEAEQHGKDGNIGIKLPMYLSQIGLKDIQCRVSDKVNFLDSNIQLDYKQQLYDSLVEEGLGKVPPERNGFIARLMDKGLSSEEAQTQYEAQLLFSESFSKDSFLAYAPNMKITYGTIKR